MAGLKLVGLKKLYDDGAQYLAVRDASLEIENGELVVLVGPSGSGKSTLLRMIAGLESISAGELYIGDRLVNDVQPQDRDIAMVFQSYALYPHMTVYENLAFALKLRKVPRPRIDERVRNAAALLDIEGILERKPRQLSGGQRQRVAVGRAIVREPQVFLFDEPLSNLDAKLRVQMRTEIAALHNRLAATMIYVTHDQVEAMTLGQRIVVLNGGEIQQIDTPLGLYQRPVNRFVAGFIGSPAMNFLEGILVQNETLAFQAASGGLEFRLPDAWAARLRSAVGEVTLGFRPEALHGGEHPPAGLSCAPVSCSVEVVEQLGHETFVYARLGGDRITARITPQPLPAPGGPVTLWLDLSALHFFDRTTGRALA
ncbi:MAG: ABC transporter ATP-binding protein [Gemmatimonadota bacterium]